MGARLVRFEFCPGENEQIEATVTIPEEKRSVIHGIVKDWKGRLVKDAVVKLFELKNPCDPCSLKPLTHTFTDECGQFLFGPLCAHKHYVVKVWFDDVTIKPLIIKPGDDCDCHCYNPRSDESRDSEFEDEES